MNKPPSTLIGAAGGAKAAQIMEAFDREGLMIVHAQQMHAYSGILTKWIGPTNTKPSRIKAWCDGGSVTVPYQYGLGQFANHRVVAEKLRDKLGWEGALHGASVPGSGYVFALLNPAS